MHPVRFEKTGEDAQDNVSGHGFIAHQAPNGAMRHNQIGNTDLQLWLARYHHCIDRIFLWMMAGLGIVEAIIHNLLQQTEIGNVFRVEYRHFLFDQI